MAHSPQEAERLANERIAEALQKAEDFIDEELEKRYFGGDSIEIWFEDPPLIIIQQKLIKKYIDVGWTNADFSGLQFVLVA